MSKAVIAGLALICAVLLFRSCGLDNDKQAALDEVALLRAGRDTLRSELNEKTGLVEYNKHAYVAEVGRLTDYLAEKDQELYKLRKYRGATFGASTTTTLRIDTVTNTIRDTITVPGQEIRVANINDPYYTANIRSTPSTTSLSLTLTPDSVLYWLGPDYRLNTSHSNKLVKVTELNSFYVKPPAQKKKNWKYWVGGLIGGAMVYGVAK
jgi:hypothetical protein